MSRYNITHEWRNRAEFVEIDDGTDVGDVLVVSVDTFWIQQSSTSPYGSTYATDEWYEFDDSTEQRWWIDGKRKTYDEVVDRIGEDEAQRILEKATR